MMIPARNSSSIHKLLCHPSSASTPSIATKSGKVEVISRMAYPFYYSFMISWHVFRNALRTPTVRTLQFFLFHRRAQVIEDPTKEWNRGQYGIVRFFKIPSQDLRFTVKDIADEVHGRPCGTLAENEIACNGLIQYYIKLFRSYLQVDVFLKIGATFIAQYVTGIKSPTPPKDEKDAQRTMHYQLIFETAPGSDLQDEKFIHLPEQPIDPKIDILQSRQKFLSENLRITAQLCSTLSFLHRVGIIHRDLKMSNIVYDPIGKNIKLIDFGLSRKFGTMCAVPGNIALASYCSSLQEYRLAQLYKKNMDQTVKVDLTNLNSPAVDIYGLGILLTSIFFRSHGKKYIFTQFEQTEHENLDDNIKNREHFYQNLETILNSLNDTLPDHLRYSGPALSFITRLIKLCLDPIPLNRPSAAQVCGMCELFSAGMTDFDQALRFIRELRPAQEPSDGLRAIYTKFGLLPKNQPTGKPTLIVA